MRKTLHTASFELAPILHQATLAFRIADVRRQYRSLNATGRQIAAIRDEILKALEGFPRSGRDVEDEVLLRLKQGSRSSRLLIRTLLKEMWEEGTLCYLNLSERLGGEERRYGILRHEFPDLDLNQVDVESAQRQLVYAHVCSYGPVTVKDIAWWSGLSPGRVISILCLLQSSIVQVSVDGFQEGFFIGRQNLERAMGNNETVEPWAEFLAHEDPSLKGYYQSRRRYVGDTFVARLFNQIGEARASIVCSGEVIGTWELDQARSRVRPRPFRPLSDNEIRLISAALTRLMVSLENDTTDEQWEVEDWRDVDSGKLLVGQVEVTRKGI